MNDSPIDRSHDRRQVVTAVGAVVGLVALIAFVRWFVSAPSSHPVVQVSVTPVFVILYGSGAVIGALAYFFPTLIARRRGHRNLVALAILNLFLGWTLIAWVGCLVWSLIEQERTR